jgi:hypothetical protein
LKITSTAFFQGFHQLRVRNFVFSKPWFRVFLIFYKSQPLAPKEGGD